MSVLRQTLASPRWSEPFLVFLVFFLAQVATLSMAELFPGDNRLLIATIASGLCASISATAAVLWIDRRHGRRYLGGMHISKRHMVSSIAAGAVPPWPHGCWPKRFPQTSHSLRWSKGSWRTDRRSCPGGLSACWSCLPSARRRSSVAPSRATCRRAWASRLASSWVLCVSCWYTCRSYTATGRPPSQSLRLAVSLG